MQQQFKVGGVQRTKDLGKSLDKIEEQVKIMSDFMLGVSGEDSKQALEENLTLELKESYDGNNVIYVSYKDKNLFNF